MPRHYRNLSIGLASASALGLSHYLAWGRGDAEATLEFAGRMIPAEVERTVEQVKAEEADYPTFRRRMADDLREELLRLSREIEASGGRGADGMDARMVDGLIREAKELGPKLIP